MERRGMVAVAALVMSMAAGLAQNTALTPPSLTAFDEEVAVCRRVMREYCAIVQKMASLPAADRDQQAEGLRLLADARKQWAAIQSKYAANPPAEYAKDKAFKARLHDIGNALEDMEKALAAGDARRSFLACGFGCGLFVQMHEQNGLNYALDKLYHLRMDIRTTETVMKTQGLAGVRPRMAALLQKRDAVVLAPPPFAPENPKAASYIASVDELSRALDRLALAVAVGDAKQVEEILSNGLMLVNKSYGIAL